MTDSLVDETRAAVKALNTQASLRELAGVFRVSHNALWKLLQGHGVRPSTLRRIRQGLMGSEEAEAFNRLQNALATLLKPRGAMQVRRMERKVAAAATDVFQSAGEPVPRWVKWLAEGKRSTVAGSESVEAWVGTWVNREQVERRSQARSRGGARALSRRRD